MEKIRMLSTLGLMGAMRNLSSAFEAVSGIHVDSDFAPTLALLKRLRAGEAADLVILTREGLDEMIGEGRVIADTAADLARSYVGLACGQGSPIPRSPLKPRCARRCSRRGPLPIRGLARRRLLRPAGRAHGHRR